MNRRKFIQQSALGAGSLLLPWSELLAYHPELLGSSAFGQDFIWGTATAAYQIEGGYNADGKGASIWDEFTHRKGKIKGNENGDVSCDFYHRYKEDLAIMKLLGFKNYRFSLSWSRIFPSGIGTKNSKGIDYYHRLIDASLENGITPWVTLYHWDLPLSLEERGGWNVRDSIAWFNEYTDFCTREFGDKVKQWMIFNEPLAFTFLGQFLGIHAPGNKGFRNFFSSVHHVAMSQAEGGRIAKANVKNADIGTTFSCSYVEPLTHSPKDINAAKRIHALTNRLFIEPSLGMGYPIDGWSAIQRVEKYMKDGDEKKLAVDFDFIGLQNYFRIVAKHSLWPPVMWGKEYPPEKRENAKLTEMGWEVYPEGIFNILKVFSKYEKIKRIIITENGAAFPDKFEGTSVRDIDRQEFFIAYLKEILRAKKEGIAVDGYFIWSFMDNFEWAEGYHPRFGLVHVDFETQKRTIKDSGYWWKEFLKR